MEPQYSDVKVVLLDIEGTVCPVSFVRDVLFPYALAALPDTLSKDWDSPTFAPYRTAFPPQYQSSSAAFATHVHDLTASDTKAPYLKALQGYLWTRGYATGALICPLFPDVAPNLHAWTSPSPSSPPESSISPPHSSTSPSPTTNTTATTPPLTLLIYSSGSIPAQQLLFSHTSSGDLTPLLSGYFDTTTAGPKTLSASYQTILEKCAYQSQSQPHEWLFLSDNAREVRAALDAGMMACAVVRPGNPPLEETGKTDGLWVVRGFDEVGVRRVGGGGGGDAALKRE